MFKKKQKDKGITEEPILHDDPLDVGGRKLSADNIENIQTILKENGLDIKSAGDDAPIPKVTMTPDASLKLVNAVFQPTKDRMPEFTYLNNVQAHELSCWVMLEAACDPSKNADDLHYIFRQSLYQHRRSVERWLAMQAISLAGIQAEDEQFGKDMKIGGL
jgi:hypothetical protein